VACRLDPAPTVEVRAGQQLADDSGLDPGDGAALGVAFAADGAGVAGDDKGPPSADHALMDPALGSLPVPDFSPGAVFGDDFDRQVLAVEDPIDGILHAGPGAQVDLAGAQADEPGQRQAGALFGGPKSGREKGENKHQDK